MAAIGGKADMRKRRLTIRQYLVRTNFPDYNRRLSGATTIRPTPTWWSLVTDHHLQTRQQRHRLQRRQHRHYEKLAERAEQRARESL